MAEVAAQATIGRDSGERTCNGGGVGSVDRYSRPAANLNQSSVSRDDNWAAARHCFQGGEAEALVKRRQDEALGCRVIARQVLVGDPAREDDVALETEPSDCGERLVAEAGLAPTRRADLK